MSFSVRPARLEDASTIAEFNRAMALETEGIDLDQDRLRLGVRAILTDSAKGFYLLAEQDAQVLGQLMITFEWSDWRNGIFWWIQSVYVEPSHRGQGVYRALHDYVENLARNTPGIAGLRRYVEKNNHAAQSVYKSVGMSAAGYDVYEQMF